MSDLSYGPPTQPMLPIPLGRLDVFGHSYVDAFPGPLSSSTNTTNDLTFAHIFGHSIGLISGLTLTNHGHGGAQLINNSRSNGGFAMALQEILHPSGAAPTSRNGGAYLFCYGINEIGNQTAANQAKVRADYARCMTAIVSKARSPDIYLAATSSQWTFGANFSTDAATAADWTSGVQTSKSATAVDSAGSSTATFTIPANYQGETLCFNLVALSGGTLTVTWGGTVTGTTGSTIIGRTDTLSGLSINAQCAYPVRFTAAATGLSAANAGQTITVRITAGGASVFTVDGCFVEAKKPPPVLWCNVPRLPCKTYLVSCGDGVTTGVNTGLTSATAAAFVSADAGAALNETDAQGAFTAGKTIASVTNGTTIVMSGNATGAFTNIKFTLARVINGYIFYSTNTNFSGATVASHSAADTDVDNMNAQIATTGSQYGSMFQIVDVNNALGNGDQVLPANLYSWMNVNGLHPNDLGSARIASACFNSALAFRPENDLQDLGFLEVAGSAGLYPGPDRCLMRNGQQYTAQYAQLSTYTAVNQEMFAFNLFVTEPTVIPGATQLELTNSPTTGSTIRLGWYDDVNNLGYPQNLKQEVTALTVGTTTGLRSAGSFANRLMQYGSNWLVMKMDTIVATAPILRSIVGPGAHMPNWTPSPGGVTPIVGGIAWRLQGVASGPLPTIIPAGATLVSNSPAFGVTMTVL